MSHKYKKVNTKRPNKKHIFSSQLIINKKKGYGKEKSNKRCYSK